MVNGIADGLQPKTRQITGKRIMGKSWKEKKINAEDIKIRGDSVRPGHVHVPKTTYTRKRKHRKRWQDQ